MKVLPWQLIEILETFLFILRKQKLLNMRKVCYKITINQKLHTTKIGKLINNKLINLREHNITKLN